MSDTAERNGLTRRGLLAGASAVSAGWPVASAGPLAGPARTVGFEALADPEAVGHEASTQARVHRGWGRRAVHATVRWLRRALAESARAWALAAGVPPDLYP